MFGKYKLEKSVVFTIVFSLIVCAFVGVALYKFSSSSAWENVNAVITKSELETVSQGMMSNSSHGDSRISYKVNIEYKYSVGGEEYLGNSIYAGIGNMLSDKSEAKKLVEQYVVGDRVSIYYDPKTPQSSALRTSKGIALRLALVVIFILVLGGLIFKFVLKNLDF